MQRAPKRQLAGDRAKRSASRPRVTDLHQRQTGPPTRAFFIGDTVIRIFWFCTLPIALTWAVWWQEQLDWRAQHYAAHALFLAAAAETK